MEIRCNQIFPKNFWEDGTGKFTIRMPGCFFTAKHPRLTDGCHKSHMKAGWLQNNMQSCHLDINNAEVRCSDNFRVQTQ